MSAIYLRSILNQDISIGELIRIASELRSENGENPEYDRALCELITDAASLPMEMRQRIAEEIGIKGNIE